jgi:hypothetical protein
MPRKREDEEADVGERRRRGPRKPMGFPVRGER